MSNETRPPLWRVLKEAYEAEDVAECDRHPDAAMIRALADWLVPEVPYPGRAVSDYEHAAWVERDALRDILLKEVKRAEAGE